MLHTPGHSQGSISLFFEEEGALFSEDAMPGKGDVPIYEDVLTSVKSIRRLREIKEIEVLCPTRLDLQFGRGAYEAMDEALNYVHAVHSRGRFEDQ